MKDLKGVTVMVTGGNGFLGKPVVDLLQREQPEGIITFSRQDYDLTDEHSVKRLFQDNKADMVIHIAADVGGIGYSTAHPAKQFYHNILMNTFVQHYAWQCGVKKFIGIGSVCAYPAETPIPFKEEYIWNGYPVESNDAYGLSKRMLLAQSIAYHREYGFNAVHLVPINLYGPRDDFDPNRSHVIPALIRKIYHAKANSEDHVEIWGTGEESREFLYVEDCAEAIVMAAKFYNDTQPVNLGTGDEIKIKELAQVIAGILNYEGSFVYNSGKPGGQQRRQLDVSRARDSFGFQAGTALEAGLRKTVEYYIETYIRG